MSLPLPPVSLGGAGVCGRERFALLDADRTFGGQHAVVEERTVASSVQEQDLDRQVEAAQ